MHFICKAHSWFVFVPAVTRCSHIVEQLILTLKFFISESAQKLWSKFGCRFGCTSSYRTQTIGNFKKIWIVTSKIFFFLLNYDVSILVNFVSVFILDDVTIFVDNVSILICLL